MRLGVHRQFAREHLEVLGLLHGRLQLLAVGGACALQGVDEPKHGVVGQDRVRQDGVFFVPRAIVLDEALDGGVFQRGDVDEVGALDGWTGQVEEVGAAPAVPAQELRLDAQVAGLLGGQRRLLLYGGNEHHVVRSILDLAELGAEVELTRAEGLVGGDLAARLLEGLNEVLGQELRVLVAHIVEDGRGLGLEILGSELRGHGALERIDEAHPEGVGHDRPIVLDGDLGVRRRRGDDGHLGRVVHFTDGVGHATLRRADDGDHLVLLDQALGDVHGFQAVGAIVVGHDLELPAQHASLGIDLLHGHFHGVRLRLAPRSVRAGQGDLVTDLDGLRLRRGGENGQTARHRDQDQQAKH